MPPSFASPLDIHSHDNAIMLGDLYYISTIDLFLYVPGGDLWTAQTVNGRFPPVKTGRKNAGKYVYMKPRVPAQSLPSRRTTNLGARRVGNY